MKERTLAVISAGLSQPSSTRLLADQLAAATRGELERRGVRPAIELVELREYAHDVVNAMLTGFPSAGLGQVFDLVAGADGVIAVTPIFNASYSGLFKSFFDVLEDNTLVDKPVLVAASGGTARHSLALEHALRPMFTYLRAVVVPTAVFAAPEDWGDGSAQEGLARRVARAAGELATLVAQREPARPADPFEEPTPFEQLLADGRS
ncbi:MAG: FMN reductase [Micromonosporaceae bacterium]|jgi:FMN reductase|nr:FMN reductase [Micromonosporaceae bacterium]